MSISFKQEKQLGLQIEYSGNSNTPYLKELRDTYNLESFINMENSDYDNVMSLRAWVYSRWNHQKDAISEKKDALYILKQAEKGERFSCKEYTKVLIACLKSIGFTVRTVHLQSESRAKAHVIYEVYLPDLNKWFFIDPQFDIMVKEDGIPINAVELRQAIIEGNEIEIINPHTVLDSEEYLEWIGHYLFYFITDLNRGPVKCWDIIKRNKKHLTLVPLEEKSPEYLNWPMSIRTSFVTNSVADFYPEISKN